MTIGAFLPKVETIIYPNTVREVSGKNCCGYYSYDWNNVLKKLVLSQNLENIGRYVFSDLGGLTELTIPLSVEKIDSNAFEGCLSLTSVIYNGTTYTSQSELIQALTNNEVEVSTDTFRSTGLSE